MMLSNVSIKRKLEAIILLTTATALLISLLVFIVVEINSARDETITRLRALATVLGANSSAAIAFRDSETAAEILSTLASQDDVIWAAILYRDNEVFAEYQSPRFRVKDKTGRMNADSEYYSGRIVIEEAISVDGEIVGSFHITGYISRARAVLTRQFYLGLVVFGVSMLVALVLSSRLQRVVSTPIQRLLATIEEVAGRKDFSCRAERLGNDELGNLVDGFNDMLEQIQSYDRELTTYQQDLERKVVKRTHELEFAKEQAEAASQAKSDFLSTISHEIRTPMSGVLGFIRLLQATELDARQKDYARTIVSSAENLQTIIDDILDFSTMESGMLDLERKDFILQALVDEVRARFAPMAREKGLELTTFVAQDVPKVLHGDPVRLRQVLINLVDNAIKFTERGEVTLRIDNEPQEDGLISLRINVRDTGIGISPEQQALLFQPFQQVDGSISREYGGTGLGLIIAKRLVLMMDGEISLYSVPGEGSTFTAVVQLEQSSIARTG